MNLEELLTKAIALATKIHEGQKDLGGNPYIYHPLYVMGKCKTIEAKIVGVLHDTLEDGTTEDIDEVYDLLKEHTDLWFSLIRVTREPGETYQNFIRRILFDPIAREVKNFDLEHNMMWERVPKEMRTEKFQKRQAKYEKASTTIFYYEKYLRYLEQIED